MGDETQLHLLDSGGIQQRFDPVLDKTNVYVSEAARMLDTLSQAHPDVYVSAAKHTPLSRGPGRILPSLGITTL